MTEEALERQLLVFANDIGALYRREQARAQELEGALRTLKTQYLETVRTLAFVVEAKDAYTGQHLERCRVYGVVLHDVGKIGIPERILNKPGPLTAAEWRVMRTHPLIGHQMLADIPFMRTAAEVVRSHHEMFDGSGYPEGLKGKDISLAARVFAVVDAFDAMTTDRPYRAALSLDHAVTEIERMAGTQFDPEVVKVFLPLCERLRPAS